VKSRGRTILLDLASSLIGTPVAIFVLGALLDGGRLGFGGLLLTALAGPVLGVVIAHLGQAVQRETKAARAPMRSGGTACGTGSTKDAQRSYCMYRTCY
jgi:hypothetical protein